MVLLWCCCGAAAVLPWCHGSGWLSDPLLLAQALEPTKASAKATGGASPKSSLSSSISSITEGMTKEKVFLLKK